MPLKAGDRVQIGGYELKVSEGAAAAPAGAGPADPFADLLGAAPARPRGADKPALVDPLAAFGMPAQSPAFGMPAQSPAFGMPAVETDDGKPELLHRARRFLDHVFRFVGEADRPLERDAWLR